MFNSLVEEMNGGWLDFDDRLLAQFKPTIEAFKAGMVAVVENAKDHIFERLDCLEVMVFGKPEWTGARWLRLGRR